MSTQRGAMGALVLGALCLAYAPILVRVSEAGPTMTAFWRLAFASPVLWLWAVLARAGRPRGAREVLRVVAPGLFFAGDLALWHWSIRFTTIANSTLLANLAPVLVTAGGWVLFGRRFRPLFLVGMAGALLGATVLTGESLALSRERAVGDALGVGTAVFYAAYILAVGRLRERYPTPTVMAWSATAAALALLPLGLLTERRLVADTAGGWGTLVALALVSHVGGQGLVAWALAHLPAAFSSVTLLLQPAAASALAWVLFAEALSPLQGVGAAVIVCGILLARRGSMGTDRRTAGPQKGG